MGRLEFQVAFPCVSGGPPTRQNVRLTAHANAWQPSALVNQDMYAQLRNLLVMLTSGLSLQIIRQQPSGEKAIRDLARGYNPRSQARSLVQLQERMHFDVVQEPAGVTDRLMMFWRLVGEYETSSGELLGVQVMRAVLPERVPSELRTHLLVTWGSRPDYAIMRQTVESCSAARRSQPGTKARRRRRARTKARESTKVSKRAAQSSRAIVVIAEIGGTSSEIVATRTPSLRWRRRTLSNQHLYLLV